ncbi:hypothetical protein RGU70_08540 [Herbaspirillum sp. RTI4]|uniref:hypothetical protein n=1 Tax=Herbaspirillum sp. RTI4 TaxID=3048640 RepID=UPI002AB3EB38|nr:hypothetical protein [Herbaspirillum sp. RTI4]MDY7578368.1 hypothetical protein [Herbaspirillum sp. RTI4]MEA9983516.1 hypothetical protein [Herbaspirillum sp. RTI4]
MKFNKKNITIRQFFGMRTDLARQLATAAMQEHEKTMGEVEKETARRKNLDSVLDELHEAQSGLSRSQLYERSRKVAIVLAQINDTSIIKFDLMEKADESMKVVNFQKNIAVENHKKKLKMERWIAVQSQLMRTQKERISERETHESSICRRKSN